MKNLARIAVFALITGSVSPAAFASGADTYKAKCAMCHGVDGSASTPAGKAMKVPPVTEFAKLPDADLIAITKSGKGKMPAYAGKLTDPEIKDVVAYLKTLK